MPWVRPPRQSWDGSTAEELRALLEPARDLKARHASILLTFDAVVDALIKAEAAEKERAAAST